MCKECIKKVLEWYSFGIIVGKGSKQSKVSRIDRSKALAAQADEAIKERIRTAPAYIYTSLCPVPELREPPKGVIVRGIKTCVL